MDGYSTPRRQRLPRNPGLAQCCCLAGAVKCCSGFQNPPKLLELGLPKF